MTTVVPTSEEDPSLAIVRFTSQLAWADAGPEVGACCNYQCVSGILSLGALQPGETRKYNTIIAPGLYAPVHQHFFITRMDMSVDCKPGKALNQWNFRIEFTPREGLVIHSVAYVDGSRGRRHVAHRLSFVEMVVPYGDPNEPHDCVADFVNS